MSADELARRDLAKMAVGAAAAMLAQSTASATAEAFTAMQMCYESAALACSIAYIARIAKPKHKC
jgi:hypothetical protein